MKRKALLLLTILLPTLLCAKAKVQSQEAFPDGTPIPAWFQDASAPKLEDLGTQYNLADYSIISSPYLIQTEAIQQLIDRCAADGGGVIVVPEGTYKTGALFFRQGTNLYLKRGAILLGSEDIADFPIRMTRIEGEWCKYFSALINIENIDGFTLAGEGTIDGNGSTYWRHFRLRRQWNPKCTNKDEQRPRLLYAGQSRNLTISGVTLQNSPFWTTHYYKCDHVKVLNCRIFSPNHPIASASTDGIDLDATSNVLVHGCEITVNDDAICFKGGKYPDAPDLPDNGPCENILVEQTSWNSSITCGSECLGVRNVLVRNCRPQSTARLLLLKMRPDTPQNYTYITFDNIQGSCREVFKVDSWRQFFNLKGRKEYCRSHGQYITFQNSTLEVDNYTQVVSHPDEYDVKDVTFRNLDITSADTSLNRKAIESGLVEQNLRFHQAPRMSWPAVTMQTKPWARWWWLGGAYDSIDVRTSLRQYADAGLGGLEVTDIYGVKGEEKHYRPFLSPSWVDLFCYTLEEARRDTLGIDLANASGWPFGGPWIYGDLACKEKVSKVWHLKSGERLKEKVVYHQQPMIKGHNVPDISRVKFPLYLNDSLQQWGLEQIRQEKDLPLIILTATLPDGTTLDLTDKVQADGTLNWTAGGDCILAALFEADHGKLVERAGPGGEGDVMDHFNSEACLKFLSKFDEAFKGRDISYLRYYFNDSYEVDDAQGMSDWTAKMFDEFQQRQGYDLRQHLPALLGQDTPDMNDRVTYDFRQTIEALILEKYTQTWHDWAHQRGKGIRNQAHGSPANILDLYSVADVPEIEGRDLISIKTAPSAAHLNGKQLVSSESATWLDEHFLGKLGDAKQALDLFFLGGVNHIFYHGTCFSPQRAEWPGWMFYAAAHFEPNNPWWGDFRHLNEYVTRTQSFLQQGHADTDVLVYYNITDLQARYDERRPLRHYAGLDREMQESPTRQCIEQLDKQGFSWDMISDRQIQALKVDPETHALNSTYKALLVPASRQLPYETIKALYRLAEAGATILFEGRLPNDVAGYLDFAARNEEIRTLARTDAAKVTVVPDIASLTIPGSRPESSIYSQGLLSTRRVLEDGSEVYFIANRTAKPYQGTLELHPLQLHDYAAVYNPMTGQMGQVNVTRTATCDRLDLRVDPGEALIVQLHDQHYLAAPKYSFYAETPNAAVQTLAGPWTLTFVEGSAVKSANTREQCLPASVTLDFLVSWTELPDTLGRSFSGTAEYTMTLDRLEVSSPCLRLDLGKVCTSASVYLNDRYVGTVLPYGQNDAPSLYLPRNLFHGHDKLTIRVSNGMGNRISALERQGVHWQKFYNINVSARRPEDRVNGVFSAIHWSPLPSGLLGPVTIF